MFHKLFPEKKSKGKEVKNVVENDVISLFLSLCALAVSNTYNRHVKSRACSRLAPGIV